MLEWSGTRQQNEHTFLNFCFSLLEYVPITLGTTRFSFDTAGVHPSTSSSSESLLEDLLHRDYFWIESYYLVYGREICMIVEKFE